MHTEATRVGGPCGWNKGMTQLDAFGSKGTEHHGSIEFMNKLNSSEYLEMKKVSRRYHEEMVMKKENDLRAMGYRAFCTSNYAGHKRVPDVVAISPEGKVVAIEMESIRTYKPSLESIRQRYVDLLMQEDFFDAV